MVGLRQQAATNHQAPVERSHDELEKVLFTDTRKSYLHGEFVDRLVLFLRGTGCTWVSDNGGCTFCGFWNATNFGEKIPNEDYLHQVSQVLADPEVGVENYPIISLYNDGSLFEEREIAFDVVLTICQMLAKLPSIKRIVIETKIIDINEEKVAALTQALGTIELEIAVGFESANEVIRNVCINKSFPLPIFEKKTDLLQRYGVRLVPLIMVKPPFLTEQMALDDVVASLVYLEPFNLARIDFELATIEAHTLMHDLWQQGLYTTPRLWTLKAILEQRDALGLKTELYISPPTYSVESLAYSENCPSCNPAMQQAIHGFNRSQSVSAFDGIECACKASWQKNLQDEIQPDDLLPHIETVFGQLTANKNPTAT